MHTKLHWMKFTKTKNNLDFAHWFQTYFLVRNPLKGINSVWPQHLSSILPTEQSVGQQRSPRTTWPAVASCHRAAGRSASLLSLTLYWPLFSGSYMWRFVLGTPRSWCRNSQRSSIYFLAPKIATFKLFVFRQLSVSHDKGLAKHSWFSDQAVGSGVSALAISSPLGTCHHF